MIFREVTDELLYRMPPVTDCIFPPGLHFGKSVCTAFRKEYRIVTEAIGTAWFRSNSATYLALEEMLAVCIHQSDNGPEPGITAGNTFQRTQQLFYVGNIILSIPRITGGIHTRRAAQCKHLKPGIIGDAGKPGAFVRKARLF